MSDVDKADLVAGPALILGANSLRAFDAPVRNPVISEWDPSTATVKIDVPRSTYVVTCEHIIGTIVMTLALFLQMSPLETSTRKTARKL